jgi:hypothetical protein
MKSPGWHLDAQISVISTQDGQGAAMPIFPGRRSANWPGLMGFVPNVIELSRHSAMDWRNPGTWT